MRALIALILSTLMLFACGQAPLSGEAIVARAEDGTEIHGTFHPPASAEGRVPVAILLPMYGRERSTWNPLIPPLTEGGIAVAAIDLRGHGESTRRGAETLDFGSYRAGGENLFTEMWMDVDATIHWLETHHGEEIDIERLALVGASVGCSVALDWSDRGGGTRAMVLLSPGTDYLGTDSITAMRGAQMAHLWMIVPETEAAQVLALQGAADLETGALRVSILEGESAHGTDLFDAVEGLPGQIARELSDWLGTSGTHQP
ncbi:alpha/beta fold hydrolase [Candidatus Sumerlaeota bacterium]|nr:alpha/beta fold hydrolase [Candidatus Sumerlaeota bacterium]